MPEMQPIYTFILSHYNQYKYIFTALDSILKQDYPAIEIIIIDDCSVVFDQNEIGLYVDKHKRDNIKSVQILINEENVGTVRSLNKALKAVTGEFVQIFASDDRLSSEKVASNFVSAFEKTGDEAEILCALAMRMDEELSPTDVYHLRPPLHERFNAMDAEQQYQLMAFNCYWSQGAICARIELYRRIGYFPERYKYVEDWPFYLYITRNGVKAHTLDFVALDHRAGGISNPANGLEIPSHVTGYHNDILQAMETEIMPYLSSFPIKSQHNLIEQYNDRYQRFLNSGGGRRKKMKWFDFWKYSKKIVIWRFCAKWRWSNKMLIEKSLRLIWMSSIVFFVALGAYSIVGSNGISDSPFFSFIIYDSVVVSGVVFVGAVAVFLANIAVWFAYRIHRVKREM